MIRELLIYLQYHSSYDCLSCIGSNPSILIDMQYSICSMSLCTCRANRKILYTIYTEILLVMLTNSIPDRLYNSPFLSCPWRAFIVCMHQIMGKHWWSFGWAIFIIISAQGVWTWGQSHLLDWGDCTSMGAPKLKLLPLVALATFHQVSLFATTSPCFAGIWHYLGWIPHMTLVCSHQVWISLLLAVIGWHWVPSVAILAGRVGVV